MTPQTHHYLIPPHVKFFIYVSFIVWLICALVRTRIWMYIPVCVHKSAFIYLHAIAIVSACLHFAYICLSQYTHVDIHILIFVCRYTSGSTSDPKGVMILHRNLAHNLFIIVR